MVTAKKGFIFAGGVFILILSIISFVFIPTVGGASSSPLVFGEWDGKPVEYAQGSFFARQIENISSFYKNMGREIDTSTLYTIMRQAFETTIVRFAILDQMKKAGYTPPKTEINRSLIQRYYSDADGKYVESSYSGTSESERISRRKLMEEEAIVARYVGDYSGDRNGFFGMKTSSKEQAQIKEMLGTTRSFYYVSFSQADYPESEVERFGRENQDLFAAHNLSMITLDSESEASRVLGLVNSGELAFADAVATYSTKRSTDSEGKIINNMRKDVNVLFPDASDLEAVLALTPGQTSRVVRAGISHAIVRCDEAQTPADFSQGETLAAVRDYMQRNERGIIEDYITAMAADFAAQARTAGFDSAADTASKTRNESAPICINYGNVNALTSVPVSSDPMLAAAVENEAFFKTAFSLKSGEISEPLVLGNEAVVFTLKEESAAEPGMAETYQMAYPSTSADWSQTALYTNYLSSDKFKNNFDATFLQYFIPE